VPFSKSFLSRLYVCPFGGTDKIMAELAAGVFKDRPARTLVPDRKTGKTRVVQVGGPTNKQTPLQEQQLP
jgi:hypothetical protein